MRFGPSPTGSWGSSEPERSWRPPHRSSGGWTRRRATRRPRWWRGCWRRRPSDGPRAGAPTTGRIIPSPVPRGGAPRDGAPGGRGGTVPGETTEALGRAARRAKVFVSMGVNECDPRGSTIYNTQLYFGPDGELLGKHRKLMPTGGERLVWGMGDGSTMDVYETPFGRLGGLIC